MSDATLVAQEIQDLASAVSEIAAAVKDTTAPAPTIHVNVPEAAPPTVNVNVPEAAPPTVNVNVPEAAPPVVNVSAPSVSVNPEILVPRAEPSAYTVRVTKRDSEGFISEFVIIPASTG